MYLGSQTLKQKKKITQKSAPFGVCPFACLYSFFTVSDPTNTGVSKAEVAPFIQMKKSIVFAFFLFSISICYCQTKVIESYNPYLKRLEVKNEYGTLLYYTKYNEYKKSLECYDAYDVLIWTKTYNSYTKTYEVSYGSGNRTSRSDRLREYEPPVDVELYGKILLERQREYDRNPEEFMRKERERELELAKRQKVLNDLEESAKNDRREYKNTKHLVKLYYGWGTGENNDVSINFYSIDYEYLIKGDAFSHNVELGRNNYEKIGWNKAKFSSDYIGYGFKWYLLPSLGKYRFQKWLLPPKGIYMTLQTQLHKLSNDNEFTEKLGAHLYQKFGMTLGCQVLLFKHLAIDFRTKFFLLQLNYVNPNENVLNYPRSNSNFNYQLGFGYAF